VGADHAEQKRYDRQAARDGDAELAAYNAYLQTAARSHAIDDGRDPGRRRG